MTDLSECNENDIVVWECPECNHTNKEKYQDHEDSAYVCPCGFWECDISEYAYDVIWSD